MSKKKDQASRPVEAVKDSNEEVSLKALVAEEAQTATTCASATGASATGASATGAATTGAATTGASATGASATGASATGASATGASATGASATGASATGAFASGAATTGASTTGGLSSILPAQMSERLIGAIIDGRYEILSLLGEGGMGLVFLAKHVGLNKIRAVKVLHQHLVTNENSLMRFSNEAASVSALEHPNIIGVHDSGMTEEGVPFMVVDYVDGTPLSTLIKENGRITIERALPIFMQIADALDHAHKKGIIHRDLKPSNVMLIQTDSGADKVKVLDFGIAKVLPQEGEEAQKLTKTGDVFGSPLYMSPEQCLGQKLDLRSDIYSMGCLMYETLTGTPPFLGNTSYETFLKHLNEPPPGLRSAIADNLMRESFEVIIFGTLAKEPEQRYQSMSRLKEHLRLVAQGAPRDPISRLKIWWYLRQMRRGPQKGVVPFTTFVAANVLAIMLIAVAVMLCQIITRAEPENYRKSSLWANMAPPKAERFLLSRIDRSKLETCVALATALEVEGMPDPKIMSDAARYLSRDGRYDDALAFYQKALRLYRGSNPDRISRDVIDTLAGIGECNLYLGRLSQAEEAYSKQIEMLLFLTPKQALVRRVPFERLALIHANQKNWDEFMKDVASLREIAQLIKRRSPHAEQEIVTPLLICQYADALTEKARNRRNETDRSEDLKSSRRAYQDVLGMLSRLGVTDHRVSFFTLSGLAETERLLGETRESEKSYLNAIKEIEQDRQLPPDTLPVVYTNYADFCAEHQDYLSWLNWRTRAWAKRTLDL